jgi:hypothetical protein
LPALSTSGSSDLWSRSRYAGLIRDMGAGPAAYNGVVVPVVAMGLSTVFEGFVWSGLAVAGSLLGLGGLLVALGGRK